MRLSELQQKEIVNIVDGKRIGMIIDAILDDKGYIKNLVLEEKRGRKFNREEYNISWTNIVKIGDDIILIDTRNIIFFPTCSPRMINCSWISANNIEKYYKSSFGKTIIKFKNGQKLALPSSYGIIDNQILRSMRLESVLRGRIN